MNDVNNPLELLSYPEFWLYYQKGDDQEGLDEGLVNHFFETSRDESGALICDPLQIVLPCLDCKIVLDVYVDFYAINAGFRVNGDSTEFQLGWWDFDCWHPFGIQWNELQQLWRYWKSNEDLIPVSPDQALLLLAKFVGIGKSELTQTPARKQVIKSAYQGLGLEFDFKEINELSACTFLLPSDDDYDWSTDEELGPVFSGENPCYSLRNRHHIKGEEGIFPFAAFAEIMSQLNQDTTVPSKPN